MKQKQTKGKESWWWTTRISPPLSAAHVYLSTGEASKALSLLLEQQQQQQQQQQQSPIDQYNQVWLQAMIEGTVPSLRILEELEHTLLLPGIQDTSDDTAATSTSPPTSSTLNSTALILTYNRCLVLLTQGKILAAMQQIYDCLSPIIIIISNINNTKQSPPPMIPNHSSDFYASMAGLHLGCLFLECLLIMTAGDDPMELEEQGEGILLLLLLLENHSNVVRVDQILQWMDRTMEQQQQQLVQWMQPSPQLQPQPPHPHHHHPNHQLQLQQQEMYHHMMQFTLCLYKARLALARKKPSPQQRTAGSGHTTTSRQSQPPQSQASVMNNHNTHDHYKVARKELKQAMEIFSTKLVKSNPANETVSVRSGSQASLSLMNHHPTPPSLVATGPIISTPTNITTTTTTATTTATIPAHEPQHQHQQHLTYSPVLAQLYQAALNLKAHTEQLKGNVKKSLILCQEGKANVTTTSVSNSSGNSNDNDNRTQNVSHPKSNNKKRTSATSAATQSNINTLPTLTTTPATTPATTTNTSTMMMHDNNVAHVYATSRKRYLACHAWSKVVEKGATIVMDPPTLGGSAHTLASDGTVTAPPHFTQANVVWNASMANLMLPESNNYLASYLGFASILSSSSSMDGGARGDQLSANATATHQMSIPWASQRKRRARLWLRLGEACVGMYVQQQQNHSATTNVQGIQVGGYVQFNWSVVELSA